MNGKLIPKTTSGDSEEEELGHGMGLNKTVSMEGFNFHTDRFPMY